MDIKGKNPGAAGRLSNFTAREFTFDGIQCASLEGILQGLKYEDVDAQAELCKMTSKAAQERGQERNDAWKEAQTLWWKGVSMARDSQEYQSLLDQIYEAVFEQDKSFRDDLEASKGHFLTHFIGKSDPTDTILTELELCHRLMVLRSCL